MSHPLVIAEPSVDATLVERHPIASRIGIAFVISCPASLVIAKRDGTDPIRASALMRWPIEIAQVAAKGCQMTGFSASHNARPSSNEDVATSSLSENSPERQHRAVISGSSSH